MSRASWVFALTVLLLCGPSANAQGKRYALIVGVKTYRPGQPLPELAFTENDADQLAKVLTEGGYKVTLMTQTVGRIAGKEVLAPLSDYVRDQLDALLSNPNLKADDVVIVALAGHGVQFDQTVAGKKVARFYFCPADADIAKTTSVADISDRNRLIDLSELYTAMNDCKAGGKLLLVDACRNDPTKPALTRSLNSVTLPALPPPPGGVAAFFSCSANQRAFEDSTLKHGVFFHHVIEGLSGAADSSTSKRAADNQITIGELTEHVSAATYDFVREKYQGAKQAPELKGEVRLTIPLMSLKKLSNQGVPVPKLEAQVSDFTNSLGMKLVRIKAGTFMMGSPATEAGHTENEDQVRVTLTSDYWLGSTEVTQGQWKTLMNTEPWKGKENVKEGTKYAASYISWDDATSFIKSLTDRERQSGTLPSGYEYALPSDAQWEYACRGGQSTAYSFGEDAGELAQYAWYVKNGWEAGEKYAHEVGMKKANPFGLSDMHGNVVEWCRDSYVKKLSGGTDPLVENGGYGGSLRVLRGGSWRSTAGGCRSASRFWFSPGLRDYYLGFRVSLVPTVK